MTLDDVLSKNPDAAYRVYEGKGMVVLPDPGHVHVLNEIGNAVWERIDGRRTLGAILEAILETYDIDRDTAVRDVLEFAAALREHKMVS
ncbi:MAG TPA: PqqD family protein [Candidatus Polarisedimenticolia bacterium]|nr:PqqD family protein [Candidatus Polarisedimenticolia bacterium]